MAGTIYLVTNTLNGKQYVGQTIVANNRVGHGSLVTKAYRKHGKESFTYEKICNDIPSRNTLNFMEKFWISVMDSRIPNGYNIEFGGFSNEKTAEETRKKLSKSLTGRVLSELSIEKIRVGNQGKIVSEETKAKIRAARKLQVFSAETKQKLSDAAKQQWARQKGVM